MVAALTIILTFGNMISMHVAHLCYPFLVCFYNFSFYMGVGMRACSVTKSWLMLCDPMDCSPPSSSVPGISQARIPEWVAIFFSRGIFPTQGGNLHLLHWQVDTLPLSHQGSPTSTSLGLVYFHLPLLQLLFIFVITHSYSTYFWLQMESCANSNNTVL